MTAPTRGGYKTNLIPFSPANQAGTKKASRMKGRLFCLRL
jgi:hypothetical protein